MIDASVSIPVVTALFGCGFGVAATWLSTRPAAAADTSAETPMEKPVDRVWVMPQVVTSDQDGDAFEVALYAQLGTDYCAAHRIDVSRKDRVVKVTMHATRAEFLHVAAVAHAHFVEWRAHSSDAVYKFTRDEFERVRDAWKLTGSGARHAAYYTDGFAGFVITHPNAHVRKAALRRLAKIVDAERTHTAWTWKKQTDDDRKFELARDRIRHTRTACCCKEGAK